MFDGEKTRMINNVFVLPEMQSKEREVKIIDTMYNIVAVVQDGGKIKVSDTNYEVKYIDETHFSVSGRCFHKMEFAELIKKYGHKIQLV
ncbi:MAG: hypothetical protein LBR94_00045 [Desulfovibrio sp.]|jgi:hypothetical protein|nr:hypothetical protein [Desulfovibrio sp.]